MKLEWIEANFGTGSSKAFAGKVELRIPEDLMDCQELWGPKKTVELAIRSYIIDERAKLKARPKKPLSAMEKLFAGMTPEKQAEALELLREKQEDIDNAADEAQERADDGADESK